MDTNAFASPTRERLYFADWLRIAAFGLLVLYHVGMVFVPWDFHVKSDEVHRALEPWMRLINPWRMGLLFVISGVATGSMLGRTGLARERSRRLLLPLVFGMAVVVPPQAYLEVVQKVDYAGGYLDFLGLYFSGYQGFCAQGRCIVLPTWNHLWFLPYLWLYTVLLLAALRWLPTPWVCRTADQLARVAGPALLALPIAWLAAARLLLHPSFGETHALFDDPYAHVAYLPLFLFGVLAARRRVLFRKLQGLRWPALAVAVVGWLLFLGWFDWSASHPTTERLRDGLRLTYGAMQWSAIVAAFGFARRYLNVDHRWRKPLTEAVFPLYLVHQTLIVVGFAALQPLALSNGTEAAVLVVVTFAGGFGFWWLARRVSWLRPWVGLNPVPARGPTSVK
jgi:hypothetical protein